MASRSVRETAEKWFGHRELLPGQEEAVTALLDGHDVLLVAPTGSGKSLTYQVAGILLEGCTVVVSPLLALQQDQVASLEEAGLSAARLSSAESEGTRAEVLRGAREGDVRFLLLSPEQLATRSVPPSNLSLLGLVRHLAFVEHSWFQRALQANLDEPRPFTGSQDHDLFLRVTERARRVAHIPEVLYHWRVVPGSAAGVADAKPYAWVAGRAASAGMGQG